MSGQEAIVMSDGRACAEVSTGRRRTGARAHSHLWTDAGRVGSLFSRQGAGVRSSPRRWLFY
jgi:hypothetical protein